MRDRLPSEADYLLVVFAFLRDRLKQPSERGGMSAEAMIIIAALVIVSLTVMGIVTAKIINKANEIDL
jgi:hypothetical protein